MTTQAEDLAKAIDEHAAAILAAAMHIHTGLSQIATALGYQTPSQTGQVAPGQPRMPGARETPAEPLRDTQGGTQRHRKPLAETDWPDTAPPDLTDPEPEWSEVLATAANPAAVRDLINRAETAEHRVKQLQAEPEWLDADALDGLSEGSLVLPRHGAPRVLARGGWFRVPGGIGEKSTAIAPARVLWAPEADRRP